MSIDDVTELAQRALDAKLRDDATLAAYEERIALVHSGRGDTHTFDVIVGAPKRGDLALPVARVTVSRVNGRTDIDYWWPRYLEYVRWRSAPSKTSAEALARAALEDAKEDRMPLLIAAIHELLQMTIEPAPQALAGLLPQLGKAYRAAVVELVGRWGSARHLQDLESLAKTDVAATVVRAASGAIESIKRRGR